ncbi:hypothetical protein ONZ45_g18680 [Pleurotus djamor]|nr:hypothetical protein ONZ45_g18680 [Pleurotus djamor]
MTAEPLEQVKLLTALRSGDPALIHPFLSEISRDSKESHTNADLNAGAAALHLAIRCASPDTIALLLAHRAIDPNGIHPPGSGTTPLHLAASLGRGDVVRLLLDQGDVDDTRLDAYGRNCRDLAKGKDVAKIIDDSRAFLNASFRSLLRSYILSDTNAPALASSTSVTSPPNPNPTPTAQLASFLSSPRARHPYLEINYIEDSSGLSLLHAAASRHDIRMIELAIRSGADVFVRHSGDTLSKGSNKEWKTEGDRIKVFLRQLANQDATLLQSTSKLSSSLSKQQLGVSNRAYSRPTPSEAPALKGYLNKYANVAKGYNTRWFVLRDGVLSYYRHQDDETIASRGSISMKNAMLKVSPGDSREKLRFEVHSNPSAASHSGTPAQRWYMKASHPVEAARWVQALSRTIEWWHTQEREDTSSMSGISASPSRVNVLANEDARGRHSGDSDRSRTSILRKKVGGFGASSHTLVKGSDSDGSFVDVTRGEGSKHLSVASNMSSKSGASSTDVSMKDRETPATQGDETDAGSYRSHVDENSSYHRNDDDDSVLNGDDSFADDSSSGNTGPRGPPYADSFDLQANTLSAQMEILVSALSKVANSPSTSSEMPKFVQSLSAMQSLQNEYISMVQAREEWYSRELKKEQKRQTAWEESLKVVVKEGEVLEQELRRRARRKGAGGGRESKMLEFGVGSQTDTLASLRLLAAHVKGKKAFVELPPTDHPPGRTRKPQGWSS